MSMLMTTSLILGTLAVPMPEAEWGAKTSGGVRQEHPRTRLCRAFGAAAK